MVQKTAEEIHAAVSAAYAARAREVAAGEAQSCCADGCCSDTASTGAKQQFYTGSETDGLPETAVSYGCGNPVAIGTLQPGEVVLDLGSGAGLDCVLAAKQVGEGGRVIGVDMTDDMLALAERNKAKVGVTNVEFRKGVMEALPVADASANVIISNCVINLSPDKDAVFREAFRVLTPGGRLHVSDVVLEHELSLEEQGNLDLWAGCISGALVQDDYAGRLRAAGFIDVAITPTEQSDKPWRSALIDGYKPGGTPRASRRATGETIELISVAGLETGACCGTDGDPATRCC
jgi:ubiquinone/menaquinone biosynthesis C-methylase UbiE